jgi:lipoprotein-releasing system permease protein
MNLSNFLAKKYYFSKSRKSFVNKISLLAIIIIALMVIAEIVVLSVFNGFTDQLRNIHYTFDSDLEIKPLVGKVFTLTPEDKKKLQAIKDIKLVTEILEDDAILDYRGSQDIVRFKGVESNFFTQNEINKHLELGTEKIFKRPNLSALIGVGIEYKFNIDMKNPGFFKLMYPNRNKTHLKKSNNSYQELMVEPIGVFRIEMEYDERYLIIPIEDARIFTGYEDKCSSVELKLKPGASISNVKSQIDLIFKELVKVEDREQRHESIYKAIEVEKIMTYLIFLLILFIASLNLYAAVSMLVLSKQKDIETLNTLGETTANIRKIFLIEGIYIILTGITAGALIAYVLVYLQGEIGLVGLPDPNLSLNYIPVRLSLVDFIVSIALTFIVSLLMITKPVISSTKKLKI